MLDLKNAGWNPWWDIFHLADPIPDFECSSRRWGESFDLLNFHSDCWWFSELQEMYVPGSPTRPWKKIDI